MNSLYREKKSTKTMLLEQVQMFESLFKDKTGREIAYKRMHSINQLFREIDAFVKESNKQSIRDIAISEPELLGEFKNL